MTQCPPDRVTVRLNDGLREELDALVDDAGYPTRSEAVRAAIRRLAVSQAAAHDREPASSEELGLSPMDEIDRGDCIGTDGGLDSDSSDSSEGGS